MASDVFISYSRKDAEIAQRVVKALEAEGFSVWYDAALVAGEQRGFSDALEKELETAAAVIVCWSTNSTQSLYVKAEAMKALEQDKLCAVTIQPVPLPLPFNAVHANDLSDTQFSTASASWSEVLRRVERLRQAQKTYGGSALPRATYMEVIQRLSEMLPEDDARRPSLQTFHSVRWELLGLLTSIEAMLPELNDEQIPGLSKIFNSGHFVPEEVTLHHAKQSLEKIVAVSEEIVRVARQSKAVLDAADR